MFKNAPPIHLYLYPILFVIGAGQLYVSTGWGWVTGAIIVIAAISSLHLISSDVMEKWRQIKMEQHFTYDTIRKMDEPTRYALGLAAMPTEIKVTVDKTQVEGNEFSQIWSKLPILPWQMKIIAQSCIKGTPLTIRRWSGEGKLLSDPQYRELEAALLNLNLIEYKHPTAPTQGVRWTDTGKQMLEQCVAAPLS